MAVSCLVETLAGLLWPTAFSLAPATVQVSHADYAVAVSWLTPRVGEK
jgi:hypothetical protein